MKEGETLRARREALGLSLEDVSKATRIPVEYLGALESGREDVVPAGPYRTAYLRAYREQLGLDPDGEIELPTRGPVNALPLALVQGIALASVLALVASITYAWWVSRAAEAALESTADVADQVVVVTARYTSRVTVRADGVVSYDQVLPGGESVEVSARDRVEVELDALAAARVFWNGEQVQGQGRQDVKRKLVFIDDRGGASDE